MRVFFLLAAWATFACAQSTASLQAEVAALRELIEDRQAGEITFYANRDDCPEGYYPVENAYGRVLVIDGPRRGTMSAHTFEDTKKLNVACTETIGVAESGFQRVCSHGKSGTSLDVKMDDFIPHYKVMACARNNGPLPVLP
jgi:hypothetical protein